MALFSTSSLWRRRLAAGATAAAVLTPTTFALAQQPTAVPPAQPSTTPPSPAAPPPTTTGVKVPAKISTTDGKGTIYIDGAQVGEGTYVGELTPGIHQLRITRPGYDNLEENITVAEGAAVNKNYTLTLNQVITTNNVVEEVDRPEGIYGGFVLQGFLTPGGTGNTIDSACDRKSETPTLTSCDTGGGLGTGIGGFLGYHFDPVGIELFLSGAYDVRKDTLSWANAPTATAGGVQSNPARDEEYTFRRAGGMLLARIRITKQWQKIRLTLPLGAGVAYRIMSVNRLARAKDTGAADSFTPDSVSYFSPAIQIEPSVGYRITKGIAVTLGFQFSIEAAGGFHSDNPVSAGSQTHRLGVAGLSSPPLTLASNSQIFIGPTLGMMFGP